MVQAQKEAEAAARPWVPAHGPEHGPAPDQGRLGALRARLARVTADAVMKGFLKHDFSGLNGKAAVSQQPRRPISLGDTRLDHLLGGGLRPGTLTEILSARAFDAAAATGFLLGLAARLAAPKQNAAILWIYEEFSHREQGVPYGPGLAFHGLDPGRLVLVAAQSAKEALWAMEEALKSRAPAVVIGELWSAKPYDLVASRRLLLAAQRHDTPALLFLAGLSGAADELSNGADLRFEVRAHRSVHPPSAGTLSLPGAAAWSIRIAKARIRARAGPGDFGIDREKFHRVFWDHAEAQFRDALPLALAPVAFDRSDRPALAQG